MHTLWQQEYEKGPQSLADAIKEMEKLQAAQQLTATLLPSSSENTMSSDDDKCFQCQELGHMACHCPCKKCFDCDEYGHVGADCKVPPSDTPARHRNNSSNTRQCDRSTCCNNQQDRHHHCNHLDRHRFSWLRSHSCRVIDTGATVEVTHEGVIPSPITDPYTTAHHTTETVVHTANNKTPHTEDPHHIEVFPGIAVDHKTSSKPSYRSDRTAWKNNDRKYKQVTIDDPPSEYYSSDEQASKSDEDLN